MYYHTQNRSKVEMLTAAMYATGVLLTASTIPWSTVMKAATMAWDLLEVIVLRGKASEPTVEILLEAIVSVIGDRERLPHVDLFCELAGWTRDKTWTEQEILAEIKKLIAGYVLAGDVRLALTEIFNEIEHLTTEYIRSGSKLTNDTLYPWPIREAIPTEFLDDTFVVGLFPYWSSLNENDRQTLLDRHHAKNYIELVIGLQSRERSGRSENTERPATETIPPTSNTIDPIHDLLHRWLVGRSATIKLVCKADRVVPWHSVDKVSRHGH